MNGVVELRQYTLKPGRRDELIALFEREFVESQEAEGMDIIGTFRDLDNPDRFVWLRGFPDMEARAKSLAAFYGGPVWKAHRNAANDTMIDSDNVLLLKPAWDGSGFSAGGARVPAGATASAHGSVTATICYFEASLPDKFIETFRMTNVPPLGSQLLATHVTEQSANTFPALPVREGENVFICFSSNSATEMQDRDVLRQETLRLAPTARSRLRGGPQAGTA
jgi:quinol monooxygenase YgiN